jgi:hypothetical protein
MAKLNENDIVKAFGAAEAGRLLGARPTPRDPNAPPRARRPRDDSLERTFAAQVQYAGIAQPHRNYRFAREEVGDAPGVRARLAACGLRDWQMDFAWPELKICVEIQGGTFTRMGGPGGHNRGVQMQSDYDKQNEAVIRGWRVLFVTSDDVKKGRALEYLQRLLDSRD